MFGILHWKSNNGNQNEVMFIEEPHGSSNAEKISACDPCRVRKVKCRIDDGDTCNRCKRLGKKCSFALKTYRGGQHTRKANTNDPELEHGEVVSLEPNEPPVVSLLPSANNLEDGNKGVFLSAELSREHSAVGSEQEILADEPRRSPSDRISPISHPDSTPPTAFTSLDEFFTWSTYLGEQFSRTPPSTTHSEDPTLLDMSLEAIPISLETSTTDSTKISCHRTSGQSSCLAATVFAVEDFGARCICNNRAQLDSILASQKEAIKRCRSMVNCTGCMAKRENLVVLVYMTENIVEACECVVALHGWLNFDITLPSLDSSSTMPFETLPDGILFPRGHRESLTTSTSSPNSMNLEHTCPVTATSSNTSSNWRGLLVGDYEISSSLEWEYLVRLLIFLQLKDLLQLLADVKDTGSTILGETQMASLTRAERRIGEFEKELSAK